MPEMQLTLFTELSCIAGQAETGVGVDSIQTGGSIQTRVRLALINICRHTTQAYIIPHHHLSVQGQYNVDNVCTCFTVLPGVSRCTNADILCSFLVAGASILTLTG